VKEHGKASKRLLRIARNVGDLRHALRRRGSLRPVLQLRAGGVPADVRAFLHECSWAVMLLRWAGSPLRRQWHFRWAKVLLSGREVDLSRKHWRLPRGFASTGSLSWPHSTRLCQDANAVHCRETVQQIGSGAALRCGHWLVHRRREDRVESRACQCARAPARIWLAPPVPPISGGSVNGIYVTIVYILPPLPPLAPCV
jgi:hypothetical protein